MSKRSKCKTGTRDKPRRDRAAAVETMRGGDSEWDTMSRAGRDQQVLFQLKYGEGILMERVSERERARRRTDWMDGWMDGWTGCVAVLYVVKY